MKKIFRNTILIFLIIIVFLAQGKEVKAAEPHKIHAEIYDAADIDDPSFNPKDMSGTIPIGNRTLVTGDRVYVGVYLTIGDENFDQYTGFQNDSKGWALLQYKLQYDPEVLKLDQPISWGNPQAVEWRVGRNSYTVSSAKVSSDPKRSGSITNTLLFVSDAGTPGYRKEYTNPFLAALVCFDIISDQKPTTSISFDDSAGYLAVNTETNQKEDVLGQSTTLNFGAASTNAVINDVSVDGNSVAQKVTLTNDSNTYEATSTSYTEAKLAITPGESGTVALVVSNEKQLSVESGIYKVPLSRTTKTSVVITIQPQDATAQAHSFTVNITAGPYDGCDLTGVSFEATNSTVTLCNDGGMTTSFNKDVIAYRLKVAASYSNLVVTPSVNAADKISKIEINGQVMTGTSHTITTKVSSFNIVVYAEDGTTTKTYKFTMQEISDDTSVHSITVTGQNGGSYQVDFDQTTKKYTVNGVLFSDSSLSIQIGIHNSAILTFDGSVTTSIPNILFTNSPLAQTVIKSFSVTSAALTKEDYTLEINRVAADTNTDMTLNVYEGTTTTTSIPGNWQNDIFTASNLLPYTVSGFNIRISGVATTSTVYIDGDRGTTKAVTFNSVEQDKKTIIVRVVAESGAEKSYTINVTRAAAEKNSNIGELDIFDANGNLLNFTVIDGKYVVSQSVRFPVKKFQVSMTPDSSNVSSVTIDGKAYTSFGSKVDIFFDDVPTATTKKVEIIIIAQDGSSRGVYTIEYSRLAADTNTDIELTVTGVDDGVKYNDTDSTAQSFRYQLPSSSGHKAYLRISLDSEYSSVTVNGAAYSADAVYTVDSGTIRIMVTAESGKTDEYFVYLSSMDERDTNYTLTNLIVEEYQNAFVFNSSQDKYYLSVAYSQRQVTIRATLGSSKATLSGQTGIVNLDEGVNIFEYKVTAENGGENPVTYQLHITRATGQTGNSLLSININGQTITSFNNNAASVIINRDTSIVANESNIIVSSGATKTVSIDPNITPGKYQVRVAVTSEVGVTANYTIYVYRADENKVLENIELLGANGSALLDSLGNQALVFDANTLTYNIVVPYGTQYAEIKATKQKTTSVLTVTGSSNLSVGVNSFTVYVTSEYGVLSGVSGTSSPKYTINVRREDPDTDKQLNSLVVVISGVSYTANVADLMNGTFKIENLTGDPTTAMVTATTKSSKSKIVAGTGNISLAIGTESSPITFNHSIVVQDETGETAAFALIISRKAIVLSSTCTISEIILEDNEGKSDYITFDPSVLSYTFEVSATVTSIIPRVTHDGKSFVNDTVKNYTLQPGVALQFTIQSKAEDGKTGAIYQFNITRKNFSTDNKLSEITINDTPLPNFDPNVIDYTGPNNIFYVPYETQKIEIGTTLSDKLAEVTSGSGEKILNLGANTIAITVKAEDGSSKTYTLIVYRENLAQLDTLGVEDFDITPDFDPTSFEYDVTVPYATDRINIFATSSKGLRIVGTGSVRVNVGTTTFNVKVYSESSAVETIYKINVTREAGDGDNKIYDLKVRGELVANFNPSENEYSIVLGRNVTNVTFEYTYSPKATIQETTNKVLNIGKNTFEITCTSETGVSNRYEIVVYRADTNFDIDSIRILNDDQTEDIKDLNGNRAFTFNKETFTYNFSVPYTTSNVYFDVSPNSAYARVSLEGLKNISVGLNEFIIYATSEYGVINPNANGTTSDKYIIKITRESANSDSSLKNLKVIISGYNQITFDPSVTTYNISDVDPLVSSVNVEAEVNATTSTVTGTGQISLSTGSIVSDNTVLHRVTVTAEDGSKTDYLIYISRKSVNLGDNNAIDNIRVIGSDTKEYLINPSYSVDLETYSIVLPFAVISYSIVVVTPSGVASEVTGTGTFSIAAGEKQVKVVFATSESGEKGTEYTINITREKASEDCTLEWIREDGVIISGFDPEKIEYTIYRNSNINSIDLTAKVSDEKSTVTGTGEKMLQFGNNVFIITVKAEDGVHTKQYIVMVVRDFPLPNLNNLLVNSYALLDLNNKTTQFNPAITEYNVIVPYRETSVTIVATSTDSTAVISGQGEKFVNIGKNVFIVTVTSANGKMNTYQLNITRRSEISINTNANSITIDEVPTFNSVYSNYKDIYYADANNNKFVVPNSVRSLTVNVLLENIGDENNEAATFEIFGHEKLKVGLNLVVVIITASDGETTRSVIVHVERQPMEIDINYNASRYAEIEAGDEPYVYNVSVKKMDLPHVEFDKFIIASANLDVLVVTQNIKETTKQVIVSISDNVETVLIQFNIVTPSLVVSVNEDASELATVEATEDAYTYNLAVKKSDINKINFRNYIEANEDATIEVLSDVSENSKEIIISVTDGENTVLVRFNVETVGNIFEQAGSNIYYLIGILICAVLLIIIAIVTNRDKFGKVVKKRRNKLIKK